MARGKSAKTMEQIAASREILSIIQPATVRAVCYQLFTRGLIANMGKNETGKVSRQLVYARESGIIPWEWIVDETREAERPGTWDNPDQIIRSAVRSYRRDYWQDQAFRVEVWSEKGTVRGTLAPVLHELGVTFRALHGFSSATVINEVAELSLADPKPLIALYVGDFDPSGMYMSEADLPARLERYGGKVSLRRIALLPEDTARLPSFDAATKTGDSRHRWFVERYGPRCWELDAMPPPELRARVEQEIKNYIEPILWSRAVAVEAVESDSMRQFFNTWQEMRAGGAL